MLRARHPRRQMKDVRRVGHAQLYFAVASVALSRLVHWWVPPPTVLLRFGGDFANVTLSPGFRRQIASQSHSSYSSGVLYRFRCRVHKPQNRKAATALALLPTVPPAEHRTQFGSALISSIGRWPDECRPESCPSRPADIPMVAKPNLVSIP